MGQNAGLIWILLRLPNVLNVFEYKNVFNKNAPTEMRWNYSRNRTNEMNSSHFDVGCNEHTEKECNVYAWWETLTVVARTYNGLCFCYCCCCCDWTKRRLFLLLLFECNAIAALSVANARVAFYYNSWILLYRHKAFA